ncbi:MAG: hypothetical protein QOG64_413 [Acidimicrobiaceae bacterium]|nr:hypothetical protein [Acidimicrobiaceae bacterium]
MTLTVTNGHTTALVVAAAVLTVVSAITALVVVARRGRLTGTVAVLAVAVLAGWACAVIAVGAENDARIACEAAAQAAATSTTATPGRSSSGQATSPATGRPSTTAPAQVPATKPKATAGQTTATTAAKPSTKAKSRTPGPKGPIDHPLFFTAALFIVTASCCGLGLGRSLAARQLSLAGLLFALAVAWLCVDVSFEGSVLVSVLHPAAPCRGPIESHGIVLADVAALVPLAGAAGLTVQALRPWRWGHSSAAVVRQS